jgi:hypothetical protein
MYVRMCGFWFLVYREIYFVHLLYVVLLYLIVYQHQLSFWMHAIWRVTKI